MESAQLGRSTVPLVFFHYEHYAGVLGCNSAATRQVICPEYLSHCQWSHKTLLCQFSETVPLSHLGAERQIY